MPCTSASPRRTIPLRPLDRNGCRCPIFFPVRCCLPVPCRQIRRANSIAQGTHGEGDFGRASLDRLTRCELAENGARSGHSGLVVELFLPALRQPVVQADPHDVIRDAGTQRQRERRRVVRITGADGIGAEAHVQIFDLTAQVSDQVSSRALSAKPSDIVEKGSPPTVAGAAPDLARSQRIASRTEFPFCRSTRPAHLNLTIANSLAFLSTPPLHFCIMRDIPVIIV